MDHSSQGWVPGPPPPGPPPGAKAGSTAMASTNLGHHQGIMVPKPPPAPTKARPSRGDLDQAVHTILSGIKSLGQLVSPPVPPPAVVARGSTSYADDWSHHGWGSTWANSWDTSCLATTSSSTTWDMKSWAEYPSPGNETWKVDPSGWWTKLNRASPEEIESAVPAGPDKGWDSDTWTHSGAHMSDDGWKSSDWGSISWSSASTKANHNDLPAHSGLGMAAKPVEKNAPSPLLTSLIQLASSILKKKDKKGDAPLPPDGGSGCTSAAVTAVTTEATSSTSKPASGSGTSGAVPVNTSSSPVIRGSSISGGAAALVAQETVSRLSELQKSVSDLKKALASGSAMHKPGPLAKVRGKRKSTELQSGQATLTNVAGGAKRRATTTESTGPELATAGTGGTTVNSVTSSATSSASLPGAGSPSSSASSSTSAGSSPAMPTGVGKTKKNDANSCEVESSEEEDSEEGADPSLQETIDFLARLEAEEGPTA